jgi:chemotaxis protein MotB
VSRKREEGEHENSERWLLTYADMITLLLVLFIMLYTISNIDSQKFKVLAAQLGAAFDPGQTAAVAMHEVNGAEELEALKNIKPKNSAEASAGASASNTKNGEISIEDIQKELTSLVDANGLSAMVSVHREERGVVVSFMDALLFKSGSASINPQHNVLIKKVVSVINSVDNYIRVEGSTDNVPIRNGQFDSNWELASQRAINLVYVLIGQGVDPTRLSVTSYGEYRPIAKNDSRANMQLNRRVDIVFLDKLLNEYEPGLKAETDDNQQ